MITFKKSKARDCSGVYCYLDGGYFGQLWRVGKSWFVEIGGGRRFIFAHKLYDIVEFESEGKAYEYMRWWANYAWQVELERRERMDAETHSIINFHKNIGKAFVPAPERPPLSDRVQGVMDALNGRSGHNDGLMGLAF